MSKIFDDDSSDNDLTLKTNNEYAKNYDQWRKKEEINKLKTKYGELDSDNSSSESEDDEDAVELTGKVEKDFFKTLSCLKIKDPRIYDNKVQFFDNIDSEEPSKKKKKAKEQPVFLKDYERKLILEKGGILSDEDDDQPIDKRSHSPTYVEEQVQVKDNLKHALNSIDDNDEGEWGGIFTKRKKTKEEEDNEEEQYKKWLAGQKSEIDDAQIKTELNPLKEYWTNPTLDDGEKFLRDYILNKRFLDKDDDHYIPTYDEIVHDSDELSNDEDILQKQEEFEHKYNFRFEEPDAEFIKRYPRIMENSLRRKDDKRKLKRQEIKERKKLEKETKMQDLKKLRELKRKEIEEKIDKLKEITGNTTLGFAENDIDGEFDPAEHDRRMQELFNDDYYEGPEDEKPEFKDLDEELEIENWDTFHVDETTNEDNVPHCEDENFNMDCDYDPKATQKELLENSKSKKRHKKKSKFAEAISKEKPKYDPANKTYEEYFEEYYKLDCEDFIDNIPCRFKYRKVVPNDFGLTVEEILMAKEKELNKWCSLKKTVQIRPDHVEKYDQVAFRKKGQNLALKQKILPSLFSTEESKPDSSKSSEVSVETYTTSQNEIKEKQESKNKLKKKKRKNSLENIDSTEISECSMKSEENIDETVQSMPEHQDEPPKKKKKSKSSEEFEKLSVNISAVNAIESKTKTRKRKKKKKPQVNGSEIQTVKTHSKLKKKIENNKSLNHKVNKIKVSNELPLEKISDERLLAYGIKPKKFKNKLKYKK